MASKKNSSTYTAANAELGARTLKTGQSRWFVGYKKHTLRLWLPTVHSSVTLIPLVSWITPANVPEGGLVVPSLRWCKLNLDWWPGIVVADMAYLSAKAKKTAREVYGTTIVTKLRGDMKLVPPYISHSEVTCHQGQPLEWWEIENDLQWFRVPETTVYCQHCWEAALCPRHFAFEVAGHETLLGLIPLASRVSRRLLRQVRPCIEPAQSFEKNQLGLAHMFLNGLRFTWQMSMWVDTAILLRTMAWLDTPVEKSPLLPLHSPQMEFPLKFEL